MLNDTSHLISLFENATEGFVLTGPDGRIGLVNPSACRMFGYSADELIGQPIELLIPASYRKHHVQLRDSFYQHPRNRVMGHGRDLYGEKKSGVQFPVEVSLSTYIKDDERYVIAFIVDISHRKEIEQNVALQQQQLEKVTTELRVLNTELEAKVEERTMILTEALQRLEQSQIELSEALDKEKQLSEIKSRFVAMASHEFRTPLSTILSSASLVGRYADSAGQEKRQRHIDKIKGSVKHLNDLLEDFLSLGKLNEGKVGTELAAFELPDLINEVVEEMKAFLKENQELAYRHEGAETVVSDKKMLRNILINLVSNAIKFSGEGAINISSDFSGTALKLAVADKGIGISREDQGHLASTFFRGKNALNIQGTGLGLHIVKRYVELLNGEMFVDSELGKGTTFTITLPQNN